MIPEFYDGVNLGPGPHFCTFEEVTQRFGGSPRRLQLLQKLKHLISCARRCGFTSMAIGGSFPTSKESPGDLDIIWFTPPGTSKDNVRPECVDLMDNMRAVEVYACDMLYVPLDPERGSLVEDFTHAFGLDLKTNKNRGMLVLEVL